LLKQLGNEINLNQVKISPFVGEKHFLLTNSLTKSIQFNQVGPIHVFIFNLVLFLEDFTNAETSFQLNY